MLHRRRKMLKAIVKHERVRPEVREHNVLATTIIMPRRQQLDLSSTRAPPVRLRDDDLARRPKIIRCMTTNYDNTVPTKAAAWVMKILEKQKMGAHRHRLAAGDCRRTRLATMTDI